MLSIGAMGSGQSEYYLALAREDYYLEGGEPPGRWLGTGAGALGLSGLVDKEQFRHLFQGFSAGGEEKLVQSAGHESHRPGWDLTFSAPKTVSVLWSQTDAATRQTIQEAHFAAVKAAVGYLEEVAAIARLGKGGLTQEPATLAVATFEHGTSRAQDPQLHTHCLVLNLGLCADGKTRTLESKTLFEHKMTAGALYRAELSALLEERLGLLSGKQKSWFELAGVPKDLAEHFSTRRQEIEALLAAKGYDSPEAAAMAALVTREVKGHAAREELFARWHAEGRAHGWSEREAHALLDSGEARRRDPEIAASAAVYRASERLLAQQSYFSGRELLRAAAEEAQGYGVGAERIRATVQEQLADERQYVCLGRAAGEQVLYTTRETLLLEKDLLARVTRSRGDARHALSEEAASGAAQRMEQKNGWTLSEEQRAALLHITTRAGSVQLVRGLAGTGKTALLEAARAAWEEAGFTVRGAALAGKAAEGLETGAGIESATIAATLRRLERGEIVLSNRSVLVVDEAGMVDTRQMKRLVDAAHNAGAKLVLVGDAKQLQPIGAGGAFRALESALGAAALTQIRRQEQAWMAEAVHAVERGEAREALYAYARAGRLRVTDDRTAAREALIADWKADGAAHPRQNLIVAGENREAVILNRLAQEERRQARQLGSKSVEVGGERIHEGDRILFTKNSNIFGVKNGHLATVDFLGETRNTLSARLDDGRRVTVPLGRYQDVKLGYAITTHKGQGLTVDNAFVLLGGAMQDLHLSYVQLSRARQEARLYTTKEEAGENLATLARDMSALRQKETAHAVLERQEAVIEPAPAGSVQPPLVQPVVVQPRF